MHHQARAKVVVYLEADAEHTGSEIVMAEKVGNGQIVQLMLQCWKSLENGSYSLEYGGGTTSKQKRLIRLLWTIQVHCCKRRKIGRRQLHVCSRGTYHDLQVTRGAQIPYESDKVSAVSSTFRKKYGLILLLLIKQSTNCRSHWSSSRAGIHIASGSLSISSSSVPSEYF